MLFIDRHARGDFPEQGLLRALDAAERGVPPVAGARPVDYLVGFGGQIFCIVEAADEESVWEFHEELGLPAPRSLKIVEGAEGFSPLSNADRDLVLRMIK